MVLEKCQPLIPHPALVLCRATLTSPGAEVRRFEGHEGGVSAVARVDEHRIVSASWDRTLRLWDLDTGAEIGRFEGHEGGANAVARVDERRVVSASSDGTLRLWDLDTRQELAR